MNPIDGLLVVVVLVSAWVGSRRGVLDGGSHGLMVTQDFRN